MSIFECEGRSYILCRMYMLYSQSADAHKQINALRSNINSIIETKRPGWRSWDEKRMLESVYHQQKQ